MCNHKWIVYGTAIMGPVIMVECEKCKCTGYIEDFTENEWSNAFHAPSNPYLWKDNKRVILNKEK